MQITSKKTSVSDIQQKLKKKKRKEKVKKATKKQHNGTYIYQVT